MQARSVLKLRKYIHLYGDQAFLAFILIGVIPFYCITMEYSLASDFALKYLSIPIVMIAVFIYAITTRKNHKPQRMVNFLLRGIIAIPLSSGYIIAFNALIGSSQDVLVEGNITSVETHIGMRGRRDYFVYLKASAAPPIKLQVDKEEYESLNNRELYSQTWKKGSLGFLYH